MEVSTPALGKIEKIEDLRTIWKHEAHDFTKWLSKDENLAQLAETIEIEEIHLKEMESSVGNFNVDLYAVDESTNRKIIIENQLEDTNHDHLGKIITYASGKRAEIIIWIVKHARDEHKQAIEWLNQHTDNNIGFFLLEIELWKIGDSLPAPKFNVVERPNDWAKTMKEENLNPRERSLLEFWHEFNNQAFEKDGFKQVFGKRKPIKRSAYDLSIGFSSVHLSLALRTQKKQLSVSIYIKNNKECFQKFKAHKEEIEKELGAKLLWREAVKDCRISVCHIFDIRKQDTWAAHINWLCENSLKLRLIAKKYMEMKN